MSQIALYRKYRPDSFDKIIGQNVIVQTLKNAIENGNYYHSYIFSGVHGSGKTSIARIFAKTINCLNIIDGNCCNECENCTIFNNNDAIDIFEIDAASNSSVEEIRKIIDTIDFLPIKFNKKIYIIDEAHMLSNSAWNALLKTIEEPPSHVIFIFASTEINKIPMTIISRCQRFDFGKLTNTELINLIDGICEKEEILISNDSKNKIALMSDGSARDCLSLLHQISDYSNKKITFETINEIFGFVCIDEKINIINQLINFDVNQLLIEIETKTSNYLQLVLDIIDILMDKLIYLKTNDINLLKFVTISDLYKINLDENKCIFFLDCFVNAYEKIKQFGNGLFYLKEVIFKLTNNNLIHNNLDLTSFIKPNYKHTSNENNLSSEYITNENIEDYSKCFKIKQVTFNDKDEINDSYSSHVILEKQKNESQFNDIDFQLIFNKIVSNQNNDLKAKLNKKLDLLKLSSDHSIEYLLLADKVLVSSSNAAILIFSSKSEVDLFLNWYWNKNNFNLVSKILNENILILPAIKEMVRNWKNNYDYKKYGDVNILDYFQLEDISEEDKIKKILEITSEDN